MENLRTKAENRWLDLPNYDVDDSDALEINVVWEYLYEKLENGRYRLINVLLLSLYFIENQFIASPFLNACDDYLHVTKI